MYLTFVELSPDKHCMKTTILLAILALNAMANTFDTMTLIDGFATNYELSSKKHDYKINLDCQSFFHKFDTYKGSELLSENYITQQECKVLETKVRVCLKHKKKVCFNGNDSYEAKCECN